MLVVSREPGESICIGNLIRVTVVRIDSNGKARLGVTAPRSVPVHREEIQERIDQGNGYEPVPVELQQHGLAILDLAIEWARLRQMPEAKEATGLGGEVMRYTVMHLSALASTLLAGNQDNLDQQLRLAWTTVNGVLSIGRFADDILARTQAALTALLELKGVDNG